MNPASCIGLGAGARPFFFKNLPCLRAAMAPPRASTVSAAGLLALSLLAGCTMPSDPAASTTGTGPALAADTYRLHADWVLVNTQAGQNFTFTLHVDGNVSSTSPHIGGHMGPDQVPASQASKTTYPLPCIHGSTPMHVPNDIQVTCTAPATPGTYYIRGHVQDSTGALNWWSDEYTFTTHA